MPTEEVILFNRPIQRKDFERWYHCFFIHYPTDNPPIQKLILRQFSEKHNRVLAVFGNKESEVLFKDVFWKVQENRANKRKVLFEEIRKSNL